MFILFHLVFGFVCDVLAFYRLNVKCLKMIATSISTMTTMIATMLSHVSHAVFKWSHTFAYAIP